MREKYESLSLATLKDLAKARGLKGVSALRKPELIERMLHEDELEGETKKQETVREKPQQSEVEGNGERIPQYNKTPERTQYHAPAEAVQLDSGERADGILEVLPDGYGFIRCENYLQFSQIYASNQTPYNADYPQHWKFSFLIADVLVLNQSSHIAMNQHTQEFH